MRAASVAVRDNLLAALQCAPLPLTTAELAEAAPWKAERFACSDWGHRTHCHARLLECDGQVDVIELQSHGPDVYPHLRAMERRGLIERLSMTGDRRVYWRAMPAHARAEEIAQLEAMWSA